jgi:hypothetical protein
MSIRATREGLYWLLCDINAYVSTALDAYPERPGNTPGRPIPPPAKFATGKTTPMHGPGGAGGGG